MNAKRYLRGMLGQGWYNFTECLAWAILYRKMPEELEYCHKVAYGPNEYCGAAEPPARWWRSHLSGLLEPPRLSTGYLAFSGSNP